MASRAEDVGGASTMVRQSSSTSCASQASTRSLGAAVAPAPYLRVMKTQLNFFMTRLLFMQEEKADSLGARATNARRMNTSSSGSSGSNSSLNFNNSASRLDGQQHGHQGHGGGGGQHGANHAHLLGPYMEDDGLDSDDVLCVFNDNARILPNSVAKSMPTIPFPPAAPESPRPVETKEGIIMLAPTHQPTTPGSGAASAAGLPEALPLSDMSLNDHDNVGDDSSEESEEDHEHEHDNDDDNDQAPDLEEVLEEDLMMDNNTDHTSTSTTMVMLGKPKSRGPRKSVPAIPTEQRVFPKNQRRSKRMSSRERPNLKRSQSDVADKDDAADRNMSTSLH